MEEFFIEPTSKAACIVAEDMQSVRLLSHAGTG